jgi:hypothetical protein
MNFVIIGFISVVVVGVMEVVKNFLPATVDKKVTSAISLGLAAVLPVGYGIVMKADPLTIVMSVIGVVGLTQTSYNFVLKLLKTLIEKLKTNVAKELTKE